MLKKIFIFSVVIIFIVIQFDRPKHNTYLEIPRDDFLVVTKANDEVISLIKSSCYDCHSNNTDYPWYGEIAPISWWISYQIDKGKHDLNFSEWGDFSENKRLHKINKMIEIMEEKTMPTESYIQTHPKAKLSEEQNNQLIAWLERL